MKRLAIVCALVASAIAAPASAAIVFTVNGAFSTSPTPGGTPEGTLTGTFTTDDAVTTVTAIDLSSSAFGPFQAISYNNVADVSAQFLPAFFQVDVSPPGNFTQLRLLFGPSLTAAGGTINPLFSFESQSIVGIRWPGGTVTAGVPEPSSWALMIGGIGLAGALLRGRRRAMTATWALT